MNKKGVSEIIGWVLMIGFAVAIGVMVSRWSLGQADEASQTIVQTSENDVRCSDVRMSYNCQELKNTGVFTIQKVNIISSCSIGPVGVKEAANLKPGGKEELDKVGCGQVSIIPIIKINEREVSCTVKKITKEC